MPKLVLYGTAVHCAMNPIKPTTFLSHSTKAHLRIKLCSLVDTINPWFCLYLLLQIVTIGSKNHTFEIIFFSLSYRCKVWIEYSKHWGHICDLCPNQRRLFHNAFLWGESLPIYTKKCFFGNTSTFELFCTVFLSNTSSIKKEIMQHNFLNRKWYPPSAFETLLQIHPFWKAKLPLYWTG